MWTSKAELWVNQGTLLCKFHKREESNQGHIAQQQMGLRHHKSQASGDKVKDMGRRRF